MLVELVARRSDAVHANREQVRRIGVSLRKRAHCGDRLHLGDKARIEYDLADPPPYPQPIRRYLGKLGRELDDDQIVGKPAMDHRPQRRIAAVASVPVLLSVELDCLEQFRHARRREQCVDRHRIVGDDARQPGLDVGDGHEQRR